MDEQRATGVAEAQGQEEAGAAEERAQEESQKVIATASKEVCNEFSTLDAEQAGMNNAVKVAVQTILDTQYQKHGEILKRRAELWNEVYTAHGLDKDKHYLINRETGEIIEGPAKGQEK